MLTQTLVLLIAATGFAVADSSASSSSSVVPHAKQGSPSANLLLRDNNAEQAKQSLPELVFYWGNWTKVWNEKEVWGDWGCDAHCDKTLGGPANATFTPFDKSHKSQVFTMIAYPSVGDWHTFANSLQAKSTTVSGTTQKTCTIFQASTPVTSAYALQVTNTSPFFVKATNGPYVGCCPKKGQKCKA